MVVSGVRRRSRSYRAYLGDRRRAPGASRRPQTASGLPTHDTGSGPSGALRLELDLLEDGLAVDQAQLGLADLGAGDELVGAALLGVVVALVVVALVIALVVVALV